jgi:hypothetical protein
VIGKYFHYLKRLGVSRIFTSSIGVSLCVAERNAYES